MAAVVQRPSTVIEECERCGKKAPRRAMPQHNDRCMKTNGPVVDEEAPLLGDFEDKDGSGSFYENLVDEEEEQSLLYLDADSRCRFCHNLIPQTEWGTHLTVCPERIEICNLCYNLVHTKDVKLHKQSGCKRHIIGPAFAARDRYMGVTYAPFGLNIPTLKKLAPYLIFIAALAVIGALSAYLVFGSPEGMVPRDFHP